jgi:hypothetical protein
MNQDDEQARRRPPARYNDIGIPLTVVAVDFISEHGVLQGRMFVVHESGE